MNKILGDLLKNAREEKKLSLDDLAKETKILKRYLIDLEEEQFEDMPGKVYERGFLKTYANSLELDEKEVLEIYEELRGEKKGKETAEEEQPEKKHKKGKLRIFLWLVLIVFIILGAVKVLEIIDKQSKTTENVIIEEEKSEDNTEQKQEAVSADIPQSEIEEVIATTEAAVVPVIAKKIEVKLSGKTWVQIYINGKKVKEGEFGAGELLVFEGSKTDQIFVKIGNIKNADIIYNGVSEDESTAYKSVWKKTF